MYRSKTSWNTNLLHFISLTHRELDTSDQNFRISDGSDPEVSRLVAWSGSDTPAVVFILAVAQTVKRQLFFEYNSLVLMHKNVWKTIHASCNQAFCVFFQAFQGLAKNQEGRRVASFLFGSWVPWVKLSWRWASEPQGQGVKPHLNVLGHSVMAEIGHPPFAKLLFCRTFLLWLCNYDIEMIGDMFEIFGFQRQGKCVFLQNGRYNVRLDVMYQGANQKWMHFLYDLWSPIRFVYVLSPGFQLSNLFGCPPALRIFFD